MVYVPAGPWKELPDAHTYKGFFHFSWPHLCTSESYLAKYSCKLSCELSIRRIQISNQAQVD